MIYKKKRSRGVVSLIAKPFVVILLLFGLFGIVWLRARVVAVEYAISGLENKKAEKLKEAKLLMAERASALSIAFVEKASPKNSGFTFPDRKKVVYVKGGKTGPQEVSLKSGQFVLKGKGGDTAVDR